MKIEQMAMELKLSFVRDSYQLIVDEARHLGLSHEDFLELLLQHELRRRGENGIARRTHSAKFPLKKYLEDFDRTKYGSEFIPKFKELETLNFISLKENIIMIGTPGAGKTHYAIALGMKACQCGKSVLLSLFLI